MLHDPRPRPRRRGRRYLADPHRLSVTLRTLPVSVDFLVRRVHRNIHPSWWLIIARDESDYDALARSYGRSLPQWAKDKLFPAVGVVDPAEDLAAYHRTRWWQPGWEVTPTSVHLLEDAVPGLTPWNHAWLN